MKLKFWQRLYSKEALGYKAILSVLLLTFVVFCFPKQARFQYEYQKGRLWQYETLYAPFDFAIQKSEQLLYDEYQKVKDTSSVYYRKDTIVRISVITEFRKESQIYFSAVNQEERSRIIDKGEAFLNVAYGKGVLASYSDLSSSSLRLIEKGNRVVTLKGVDIFFLQDLKSRVYRYFSLPPYNAYCQDYYTLFFNVMRPDILVDESFTHKILEQNLDRIIPTRGVVKKGQLIIAKGAVVEGRSKEMLDSLQKEYHLTTQDVSSYNWAIVGYCLLVLLVISAMILYLYRYRYDAFEDNMKYTLIVFNVVVMVWISSFVTQRFSVDYVYIIPYAILPLTLKAFLDLRVSVFVYLITILLCGFIVENSFHFIVIQIIAGFAPLINITQIHHRVNLFLSAGYVVLTYILAYIALYLLSEGSFSGFNWLVLLFFAFNGFIILFVQPLIYIYEKVFGLVSDVSLLELSDTNSPLLKRLAEKAPGTFHHSIQVANLAEAAAFDISANAMLVRVGALYHDIGKLNNPLYFTENQTGMSNPHDELTAEQSANIIINHVTEGIELAKKYKIPDRIIDFIRTHHGTSLVYYFYKKHLDEGGVVDNDLIFRYLGPLPFSKETVILMMADSVEAASKSLKHPDFSTISMFVDKIIDKQMQDGQYLNSDITLSEIERIKKVFKEKLSNIYHIRVEYPE